MADARPDVEAAFPTTPNNYRAAWGYMLLTNMLPDLNAHTPAGGDCKICVPQPIRCFAAIGGCYVVASAPSADPPLALEAFKKLERARGFEPPTPTLARLCSTPELHPHPPR